MRRRSGRPLVPALAVILTLIAGVATPLQAQRSEPLATPLPPDLLQVFAQEVSGQMAFDNMVKLAGAPWLRTQEELTGEGNFYESEEIFRMARAYGIETVRFDRYEAPGTFDYPLEGELWVDGRRVARIPADPALVASGTRTGEVEGRLVYVPEMPEDQIPALEAAMAAAPDQYRGSVALMWSHPRGALFQALDRAGVRAVISFGSRERYFDPDQVVYARGSYGQGENLTMGFAVSWRQWSEMMEDVQRGLEMTVRARAVVESYPNRFETVYAWIPGTEPELPGVVFTGHLFEGYTKRGANDNMGGPAIQLEILRTLNELIQDGTLPQPRRTIHFIWPNEISGTYEFLRRDPDLADRLSININMDMVSEGLRNANSWFTMSETPAYLASYYDGLAASVLNYVWRTNDIVYLPGAPRGRPGGQYFPDPIWEKNGSRDAFRYFIHEATGGSDHIVFNNRSVGVPGIEFFTWPDQWYHADSDTPDKGDPTEMRRVAFIGASTAWGSANLTDEMLPGLLRVVSDFGYDRVAERVIPGALEVLEDDDGEGTREEVLELARDVLEAGMERERDAVRSIREIYTGSPQAQEMVTRELGSWEAYEQGVEQLLVRRAYPEERDYLVYYHADPAPPTEAEMAMMDLVPRISDQIRSQEFSLGGYGPAQEYFEENPGAVDELGLTRSQTQQILNYVDGRRSAWDIRERVAGALAQEIQAEQVVGYLELLEEVGWLVLEEREG